MPLVHELPPTSTCFNRFVTSPPRGRPAIRTMEREGVPSIALHLRTGFADVESRLGKVVVPDTAASAGWFASACGHQVFQSASTHKELLVLSDSPGLLRHIKLTYPHISATVPRPSGEPTRSWFTTKSMKHAVLDDVILAGLATVLKTAPQSSLYELPVSQTPHSVRRLTCNISLTSTPKKCLIKRKLGQFSGFYKAVVGRSVCNAQVEFAVPECPAFQDTFFRDIPSWLSVRGLSTVSPRVRVPHNTPNMSTWRLQKLWVFPQLRKLFPSTHPCQQVGSGLNCALSYIAALK
uniref:Uncharacterized protein n=1 Tax=Haptolina ericina TaxID=156174 RepID=A0A7S3B6L5_9EUKA